ncbi:hypothetical protein LTR70_002471 [Exophiala xenobiotica]|uniref:Probable E3 ubiquitin ligase complex SCF subunit sconB n=1 Tax=Lithohypha guttulata TaxID=1690604 RepID=A0ABR0KJV1_9EURO|nr:hypothetical protein LTR24_001689 [Lithohypha guttulata]KAK5325306.1 hypothetical protein LTR70_002471 [Exophiala xenobiotica]
MQQQQDSSACIAPNRRASLVTTTRPATSGNPYATTSSTPSDRRRDRFSYHPPPSYQNNEWRFLRQTEGAGPVFVNDEQMYTDPFAQFQLVSGAQPPARQHARRPSSLADSIRNGFSSVRSLGRRMSLSMRNKSRTTIEGRPELETVLNRPDTMASQPRSQSRMHSLRSLRRPSMPILDLYTAPENELQDASRPALHRGKPSYHQIATLPQRPEYPTGGAGARASAAAQNEALYQSRATPLPPYRPRSGSYEEHRDSESGIGIVLDDLERSDSRAPHLLRHDPADILAPELLEHIFSFLDAPSLVDATLVSRKWRDYCQSQSVWRVVFYREYAPTRPTRVLGAPRTEGLGKNMAGQDWRKLYAVRKSIDRRWANGEAAAIYLNGHKDSVYCVQFDEDKIITGSRDKTIRVWDARTYQCLKKLAPPDNEREQRRVERPDVEPSGMVPFFKMDASSMEPRSRQLPMWHHASVLCLQYDSEILVTGSSDFTCIVWSIKNDYEPMFRLTGHRAGVLDVCIDSTRIITCSKDSTIKIWNRFTGSLIKTLTGHRGPVNAVQVRGNLLASASGDTMAKLWRLDTGMCIKEFRSKERGLACVEFSEDGRTIFAGGNDHVIYEYDTTNGNVRRELHGHKELVRSLHLDTAHERLISGSYDHSLKVWDTKTGTGQEDGGMKLNLEGWTSSWMLAAKSSYRKIACASQDGRVVIIDFGFGISGVDLIEA